MKFRKILCLVSACCLLLGLTSCAGNTDPAPQEGQEELASETAEYRFPAYYKWFLGKDYYKDIMSYLASGDESVEIDKAYGEAAYEEGNYLIVQATEDQRDALIGQNDVLIDQAAAEFAEKGDGYKIEYAQDYSTAAIYLDQKSFIDIFSEESFDTGGNMFGIISLITANRVLETGDCDSGVDVTIVNVNSGFVASSGFFPYEDIAITDKDWAASETADVNQSSEYDGYSQIRAEVTAISEEKIIFQPDPESALYTEDEELALCLDSTAAEDITLPYNLEEGDQVLLTVDGMYSLHEDGDDIPDIAPLAVIPSESAN